LTRPVIKYCGNHSLEDFTSTTNSSAHYIGVVFADSKRRVAANDVADWLKKAPLGNGQNLVGLFVNPSPEMIRSVVREIPIDIIQCHGTESKEDIRKIKSTLSLPVWKVIHHDDKALEKMQTFDGIADGYVVDCKVKGQWGGTGQSFDWEQVPRYLQEASRQGVRCFIAGGISADNVPDLLRYEPDGIDLSSGIERNGTKNPEKIKRLEERILEHGTHIS
jgi:phosphoribosylanthranilate isomerase